MREEGHNLQQEEMEGVGRTMRCQPRQSRGIVGPNMHVNVAPHPAVRSCEGRMLPEQLFQGNERRNRSDELKDININRVSDARKSTAKAMAVRVPEVKPSEENIKLRKDVVAPRKRQSSRTVNIGDATTVGDCEPNRLVATACVSMNKETAYGSMMKSEVRARLKRR
jgi:hypothetical protein